MEPPTHTPVTTVRLPRAVTGWLDSVARDAGVTRSDLLRAALQQATPPSVWPEHLTAGTAVAQQALDRQARQ